MKRFSPARVFDLACQRHIGLLRHLFSCLLAISSYSVSSELHVPSHLDDRLKMLPRHFPYCIICLVLPFSVGNKNTVKRNPNILFNKIGRKPCSARLALGYRYPSTKKDFFKSIAHNSFKVLNLKFRKFYICIDFGWFIFCFFFENC